jgi:membrane-associated phospholipid phosphatase
MSYSLPRPLKLALLVTVGASLASSPAWCQTHGNAAAANPGQAANVSYVPSDAESAAAAPPPADGPVAGQSTDSTGLGSDIKAYFTAPLYWDQNDWIWFGGALAAIGAAHHYDTDVRKHFTANLAPGQSVNSDDVHDAIPTAAVFVATWGYANLVGSSDGRSEAWNMLEAAGLSGVTAYALKYAGGREGPDQTSDPNEWLKGSGGSFPSFHSTAAFAVGTVLAESGNDDYRWLRRLLGYGLGVATSYERLKHNQHWLSDTVAGAALGTASAHFTMNRTYATGTDSNLALVPVAGGAMLTYRLTLP